MILLGDVLEKIVVDELRINLPLQQLFHQFGPLQVELFIGNLTLVIFAQLVDFPFQISGEDQLIADDGHDPRRFNELAPV